MGQECGDFRHGHVGEFLRFKLMKASAVDASFAEKLAGRDRIEQLPHATNEAGIARHRAGENGRRVHSEVDVRHSRAGAVQDETERSAVFGVAAADIRADYGGGRAVLLAVPE